MKPFLALAIAATTLIAIAQNQQAPPNAPAAAPKGGAPPAPKGPDPNSQYRLGPDSMPQPGVPQGEMRGPFTLACNVYPGTQHTYWVYVPAQYDPAVPASLMIFNDGQ